MNQRNDCYKLFILSIVLLINLSCSSGELNINKKFLYWSSNNPFEIKFAAYIVDKWNEQSPDKPVFFQPVPEGRSSEEIILAAVVGKTTPDIYSNMWQGDVEFFARSGILLPLDTLDGFMEVISRRCDSLVIEEITSYDGHIYQVPLNINPIMLLYNKNIFNSLGWEGPPATYSEYIEAGRQIKRDADGDGYVDRWVGYRNILTTWWQRFFDFYALYLGASGGGKLIDNGRVVFDNKYAVQVFSFLKTLYDNNYFTREMLSARQDAFLAGEIASRFTGPWEIIRAEKWKPDGFEYSFDHLPVPDDQKGEIYTYGDPKNIVLFNTCNDPQRAWEFIEFMISKENDLKLLEITTQLPRRKNIYSDSLFQPYFQNNPQMVPFAKQAKFVRGTDISPQLKEIFDVISQEYEACVIYGVKSPEQAIKDAAEASQALLQ